MPHPCGIYFSAPMVKDGINLTVNNMSIKRNSNIEALRILAMFLILMLHVNFYALGEPSFQEAAQYPVPTFARCVFQSLSLIYGNGCDIFRSWNY